MRPRRIIAPAGLLAIAIPIAAVFMFAPRPEATGPLSAPRLPGTTAEKPADLGSAEPPGRSAAQADPVARPGGHLNGSAGRDFPRGRNRSITELVGRVLRSDLRPAPHARVRLVRERTRSHVVVGEVCTDAEGWFSLPAPPYPDLTLAVCSQDGEESFVRDVRVEPGMSASLGEIVLCPSGVFEGMVVDDRLAPVSGAIMRWLDRERVAGADGGFRFDGLPEGETTFLVLAPGFSPCRVAVGIQAGRITREVIRLERGAAIAGRVVDGRGEPLAGARVQRRGDDVAVTDSQGRFVFDCLSPEAAVAASVIVRHDEGAAEFPVAAGEDNVLVLSDPPRWIGRVITGEPPFDVEVEPMFDRSDGTSVVLPSDQDEVAVTTTRDPAVVEIRGLLGGRRYRITLRDARSWTATLVEDPMPSPPGGAVERIVELAPPRRINGRVVDHGGQAVADAWVQAVRKPAAWRDSPRVRVNTDGLFELELPSDADIDFALRAGAPGFAVVEHSLAEDDDGHDVTLALPRAGRIEGVVADLRDNDPRPHVIAWPLDGFTTFRVPVAAGGRFSVADVPPGRVLVALLDAATPHDALDRADDARVAFVDLEPGDTARVDFDFGRIRGGDLVVRALDGAARPIAGVPVQVRRDNAYRTVRITDGRGAARFRSLVAGRYDVAIGLPGDPAAWNEFGWQRTVHITPNQGTAELAEFLRVGSIRIDAPETLAAEVLVEPIYADTAEARFGSFPFHRCAPAASTSFSGMPAGTYRLRVSSGGASWAMGPFEVIEGRETQLMIVPPPER